MKGVVFDAFGTLVSITDPRRPYRALRELAAITSDDFALRVLCSDMSLAEVARYYHASINPAVMRRLEEDLHAEVASVEPFPDAVRAVRALRDAGIPIAICSNLASPYAAPVLRHFPDGWDHLEWSFAAGIAKPSPAVYAQVSAGLSLAPAQILMVGDTWSADVEGPRAAGMQARLIDRSGRSGKGALDAVVSLEALAQEIVRHHAADR